MVLHGPGAPVEGRTTQSFWRPEVAGPDEPTATDPPPNTDELSDGAETTSFRLLVIDAKALTSPVVLGAVGGLVVGLALLIWPGRSDLAFSRLVAFGLLWGAAMGGRTVLRREPRRWQSALGPVVALVASVVLVLNPGQSPVFAGRVLGAMLLAHVAWWLVRLVRSSEPRWGRLPFLGTEAAIGLLLVTVTGPLLAMVISVAALLVVGLSALVLAVSLDPRTEGAATYRSTSDLVIGWLRDRPKSVDARQALYDKILYEGPNTRTRVTRFFTLMGFASVIASMGVISDSTAVVIGAMLVAPLMTPLMGMAISLVMGWPNRLTRASTLALGGIVFAIAIGLMLGLTVPATIDTATNAQILGRSSPTVLDLITAVAAGGAGAYGLSRPDVSDSLPGVAIAISLVPPLTVVGIALSQGDFTSAFGSLLLFATNMVAILIVGGLTFVLTGVTPIDQVSGNQDRVRTALGATATGAILVLGALLLNGDQIATDALQQSTVDDEIEAWLPDNSRHRVVEARIQGNVVAAVIIGPAEGLPEVRPLAERLSDELDREITVDISLVVEERLTASSSDG